DQLLEVPQSRLARRYPGELRRTLLRELAQAEGMLGAEADAEPCVDQLAVVRRHVDVVARPPRSDPQGCGVGIQVADELGPADGVAGELDPRVRPPALVQPRGEDVAILGERA